jgi:hypothetical protein
MPFQSAPLAGKDNKGEDDDKYAVHSGSQLQPDTKMGKTFLKNKKKF